MKSELDDLITIQDGMLHDLRGYLNKQTKRVQELENHITKMAVSRCKDSEELDEVNKQNKRYRERIEYMLEEVKDHKRKGLRIQHWALIKDLEETLEGAE